MIHCSQQDSNRVCFAAEIESKLTDLQADGSIRIPIDGANIFDFLLEAGVRSLQQLYPEGIYNPCCLPPPYNSKQMDVDPQQELLPHRIGPPFSTHTLIHPPPQQRIHRNMNKLALNCRQ
jgi:hypothetical protein